MGRGLTRSPFASKTGRGGLAMSEILIDDEEGVRTITLNRPDRLNALTGSIMTPLADACADAARDSSVGCVIVTGAGRGFCAGGDLKEGGADKAVVPPNPEVGSRTEQGFSRLRGFMETSRLLHEMPKPTIAMVNGPVAGAGIGIAGACDLRFAARSATFLTAFDRIGASGDFGSTWFWTRIVGTGVARELFFLGEKLSAEEAFARSDEHTSELQSLMRISYAGFCLKKKTQAPTLNYRAKRSAE